MRDTIFFFYAGSDGNGTYPQSQKVERRLHVRAQIILDWMNGLTYEASSEKNGVTKTEAGTRRYSQHEIATLCGMNQSWVSEILRAADLKPHKTDYCCGKRPDPDFESKMIDIIGLYLHHPENALVLSVDEKTQIQTLDRIQPELPLCKGHPGRLTTTYKRNGTVNLMAALAVQTGEITAREVDRKNSENLLKFLKHLDRKYHNVQIHVIMDNLATHKNKKVKQRLTKKENSMFILPRPMPPGSIRSRSGLAP